MPSAYTNDYWYILSMTHMPLSNSEAGAIVVRSDTLGLKLFVLVPQRAEEPYQWRLVRAVSYSYLPRAGFCTAHYHIIYAHFGSYQKGVYDTYGLSIAAKTCCLQ